MDDLGNTLEGICNLALDMSAAILALADKRRADLDVASANYLENRAVDVRGLARELTLRMLLGE